MSDCLFCKIIAGDIPSTKVYEDEHTFAFRDIAPKAPTHVLVIPKKHIPTTNDLTPDNAGVIGKLALTARKIAAEEGIAEDGYRMVLNCNRHAGQTVFHIHLHLLGGRNMTWPPG